MECFITDPYTTTLDIGWSIDVHAMAEHKLRVWLGCANKSYLSSYRSRRFKFYEMYTHIGTIELIYLTG